MLDAYLFGRSAPFRPYLSLAAFARVATLNSKIVPSAPVGTTLFLGIERRIAAGCSAFFELGVAYYPFCDGYLTAVSKSSSTEGPYGFSYGDTWFIEYPQFRLGVRFFL